MLDALAGNRELGSGFQAQESLEHQIGVSCIDSHLDGTFEPHNGMFVSMLPDDVAAGLDVDRALLSKALLYARPGQVNNDDVFVHRLVGSDAEVLQANLGLQVEIDGFAGPTPGVSLQGLFGRASEIRTDDVRRGFLPGVPLREVNTDMVWDLG